MFNIGERIKSYRINNKLTQQELADKLFVSDKTVSSWESGRTEPDINMLSDICNALNINFLSLVSDKNNIDTEIELKIKVSEKERDRVLNLIKNDVTFIKEEDQDATYYKLPHRDMNNEWLRVRRENNNYILNYKKKNKDIINEYEVSIDNIDNLRIIFQNIDLEESVHVNKHRISYMYKDKYEISFDNVELLGLYIEIELKKYEYDIDTESRKLLDLLNGLNINVNSIETRRYPELVENFYK